MNKTENPDSILSIFSLEYINLVSPEMNIDITKYRHNSNILENEKYWGYNCEEDSKKKKRSKYPWYCTEYESEYHGYGCSIDYQKKTYCGSSQIEENKCYDKFIEDHCRDITQNNNKEYDFEIFMEKIQDVLI